jgi:hypothetical protein
MSSFTDPHHMYLFDMPTGKKKLSYGTSPADAFDNLRLRLTDKEMSGIDQSRCERILQRDLRRHINELG